MESRMWAPPEAASLDVKRSADLGVPIGFESDVHTVRRAEMYALLHQLVDDLPVLENNPDASTLWVTPQQRIENDRIRATYGGRSPVQQLTASFKVGASFRSAEFCVSLGDDVSRLLIEPVGRSWAEAFEDRHGAAKASHDVHSSWRLLASAATALGLQDVACRHGDDELTFREFWRELVLATEEQGIDYPSSATRLKAIRLKPVVSDSADPKVLTFTAIDDLTHNQIDVLLPAEIAWTDLAQDRAILAASVALHANRRMRFRRPISSVAFDDISRVAADRNPFAAVVKQSEGRRAGTRALRIHGGFVYQSSQAEVRSTFEQYRRQGFFVAGRDAMLIATAHAVADAAIDDRGVKVRNRASVLLGGFTAAVAVAPIIEVLPPVIAGPGFVLGALMTRSSRRVDPVQLGAIAPFYRLGGWDPELLARSTARAEDVLNLHSSDQQVDVVGKVAAAGFLDPNTSIRFGDALAPIMHWLYPRSITNRLNFRRWRGR